MRIGLIGVGNMGYPLLKFIKKLSSKCFIRKWNKPK